MHKLFVNIFQQAKKAVNLRVWLQGVSLNRTYFIDVTSKHTDRPCCDYVERSPGIELEFTVRENPREPP